MGRNTSISAPKTVQTNSADPIVTRLAEEDPVKWWNKPNLRRMYVVLFACCMGVEITSGFDSTLIGTLQMSEAWKAYFSDNYVDPEDGKPEISPSLLGFVSACYQLGSIFGVPIAPYINQTHGRRACVMIGSLIMCVGALLQGFAQHIAMYIIARMILGFGIVFCIISGSSLLGELGHPKDRPTLTSLFNASYFIGQIIASSIAIPAAEMTSDWGWRMQSLLQICPSLLQITTIYLLPESPRYLISKDRNEEALRILVKYHGEGDENSPLVKAEMTQIRETLQLEASTTQKTWLQMIKTKGMRHRVIVAAFLGLFTQMSGNTLLSYYQDILYDMMGYTYTYAKTRINVANACWSLITATTAAFVVARFKRRTMFMLSAALMCSCFTAMTVAFNRLNAAKLAGRKNQAAGIAALFFYFAYAPCYNIGNNALTYTYLIELFPYSQRTHGIGVQQVFGKAGGFFSMNVNPPAMDAIGWKFFAIYCGWIAFEVIFIYFMYPETSGRTLEELAFLFEDPDLAEQAAAAVEHQMHKDVDAKETTLHVDNSPNKMA
ncbi:hypothetical protein AJ79_07600 [Helicocarpus griseus UAMH5409]|uniref:Major facilitator superfamily (MFS) profile domain-containing protein n=1 Tax=Helicocarpus griseus UAMH5409 TaxID=1447875 RepID=A0A2B7X0L0_9EURO|nr:hypothetical protein AJ79_07600 [Helicocarpus griseus UAMH5409]